MNKVTCSFLLCLGDSCMLFYNFDLQGQDHDLNKTAQKRFIPTVIVITCLSWIVSKILTQTNIKLSVLPISLFNVKDHVAN